MNVISVKRVKIRKPRQCFGCLRKYPVTTEMECSVSFDSGKIYSCYICKQCREFIDTLSPDELEDGFYEGDLLNYEEYRIKITGE